MAPWAVLRRFLPSTLSMVRLGVRLPFSTLVEPPVVVGMVRAPVLVVLAPVPWDFIFAVLGMRPPSSLLGCLSWL